MRALVPDPKTPEERAASAKKRRKEVRRKRKHRRKIDKQKKGPRKKRIPKVMFSLYLPKELLEKLRGYSATTGDSMAQFITEAIEDKFEWMEDIGD